MTGVDLVEGQEKYQSTTAMINMIPSYYQNKINNTTKYETKNILRIQDHDTQIIQAFTVNILCSQQMKCYIMANPTTQSTSNTVTLLLTIYRSFQCVLENYKAVILDVGKIETHKGTSIRETCIKERRGRVVNASNYSLFSSNSFSLQMLFLCAINLILISQNRLVPEMEQLQ